MHAVCILHKWRVSVDREYSMTAWVSLKWLLPCTNLAFFLQRCSEVEETDDFNWLDPAWSHQEVWKTAQSMGHQFWPEQTHTVFLSYNFLIWCICSSTQYAVHNQKSYMMFILPNKSARSKSRVKLDGWVHLVSFSRLVHYVTPPSLWRS